MNKACLIFVEPAPYISALIREVYARLNIDFDIIYMNENKAHKFKADKIELKENIILSGNSFKKAMKLISILSKGSYDFVLISGYAGLVEFAAIMFCIITHKIFAIPSDTQYNDIKNPIKAFLKRIYLGFIFKFAYGFPFGTRQVELFKSYGMKESNIYLMPMTIDVKSFNTQCMEIRKRKNEVKDSLGIKEEIVFLYVGRLTEVKNIDLLIDAFSRLYNQSAALVIVGAGDKEQFLKQKVAELKLKSVYFKGAKGIPELFKYYAVADVFVLPSSFEPWGLVVNEALACGIPVIVSHKVGASEDLVKDEYNGFIFKSGDEDELFSCMRELAFNSHKRTLMGENSYNVIKDWTFDSYTEKLKTFMDKVYYK